jgi:tetratricopeptide (TPR) repeat protein
MTPRNPGTLRRTSCGAPLAACALVVMVLGCGGSTSTHKGAASPAAAAKARPREVKPAALREIDAGLRALRLGGPEANERAAEAFERAVAADPTLWEAWHDLGVVRAREGDDRRAVAAYGTALQHKRDHAPSLLARAEAHRRLGRRAEAKADYEAALALDEDDAATRLRLASLLREAGDTEGSLRAVREVLRRSAGAKELADANVELGLIYLAAGREELAGLVLSKAASADAKNPRVWNALGLLALKGGRDQEAFQHLDRATNLDPTFRDARFNKATVLLDAGDYKQAKAELDAALAGKEDAADLDALVALGVADRGLGEHRAARSTWERVLRVAPMHADALYNLGLLHMDFLKEEPKAREYFTKYMAAAADAHPRRKDAESRLADLGGPIPPPAPPPGATPVPKKR